MKKLLLILILSLLMVSCGDEKEIENNAVINVEPTTTTTVQEVEGSVTTTTTNPPPPPPVYGSQVGSINIPSIGVSWPIFEGIELRVLNKGPGHYPHSPLPCRAGNASIAGHRTTYGAPFNKLNLLKEGDIVHITTPEGDCTYKYVRTEVTTPNNVNVVMPKDDNANLLTLTACHPKGSARQRIVATFVLDSVTLK